jgi:hypothetical protein
MKLSKLLMMAVTFLIFAMLAYAGTNYLRGNSIFEKGYINFTNETMYSSQFISCTAMETDANGKWVCGTDDTGAVTPGSNISAYDLKATHLVNFSGLAGSGGRLKNI